jgi:S-formylglutathione hydrolase FrmB
MPRLLKRLRPEHVAWLGLVLFFAAANAHSQERADCRALKSTVLHTSVRYCVYLPASYTVPGSETRKYPVLYLLHGLGGNQQTAAVDGEWNVLQDLRREHKLGDFLVVAPDAWDTFYINSHDGKTPYGDFFLREFMPYIERTYRARAARAARGITGFSMGGYGALRIAFGNPELFGSVSAHSAALMRQPPQGASASASSGDPAARLLVGVFGDPIDRKFWDLNSPFVLARKNAAALVASANWTKRSPH